VIGGDYDEAALAARARGRRWLLPSWASADKAGCRSSLVPSRRDTEGGRVTGKPRDQPTTNTSPLHAIRTLELTDPPVGTALETYGVVEQSRLSLALHRPHAHRRTRANKGVGNYPPLTHPRPHHHHHYHPHLIVFLFDPPTADSPVARMPTSPVSPPYYYQNQPVNQKPAPVSVTPHTPPSPASVRMSSSAHNGKDQSFPTPPSSYVPTNSLSNRDLNSLKSTPPHANSDMDTDMPDAHAQPPSLPSRPVLPLLCQSRKA